MTHICIVLFVAAIVVMTIHEIVVSRFVGEVKINSICVMIIVASVLLELGIYRIGNISTPQTKPK